MRFIRFQIVMATLGLILGLFAPALLAQETTGGLQGTVADSSGAVVAGASVTVTAPTLVGSKETKTDAAGYYRFANLPPDTYTVVVKAQGFETYKQAHLRIEVGHLPSLNIALKVGSTSTVVEVTSEGPMIDTTTVTTLTNIPEQALENVPHGTSFQSVIQFAPSARNEPLMGNTAMSKGNGGASPGSMSNGGSVGYSIGGGSDSENSYLVEGQETANIIGGFSHTQVPMDFVKEVQMKTGGVQAEYGGALGGVVNVIMQKGTNQWHGSIFTSYQPGGAQGSPVAFLRYNPASNGTPAGWGGIIDPVAQDYQPIRPHTSDVFPGISAGGPLADILPRFYGIPDGVYQKLKERIFLFASYNPEFNDYEETLNYGTAAQGGSGLGVVPFSQNFHTDYGYARIDAEVSNKVRVFGSVLSQGQKEAGENLPTQDSTQGYLNGVTGCEGLGTSFTCPFGSSAPSTYAHTLGYTAPNLTLNTGADITLTQSLVSTTRFGYYFENYHDWGFPTTGVVDQWELDGTTAVDTTGTPLSVSAPALVNTLGYLSQPLAGTFTHYNSNKAVQFDQDISWVHAGKGGTHDIKFGYQLHRNTNLIQQGYNAPLVEIYPGASSLSAYSPIGSVGDANCGTIGDPSATPPVPPSGIEGITGNPLCVGTYGVININDYGTAGTATGVNHSFYVQDSWTLGKGITVNAGVRFEREYLPGENQPVTQKITQPINFGWGAKIAPRIGAAWDVFQNGKMKVFGGYGEFYDQMKLNVAISSYGGQNWEECWFGLMEPTLTDITPAYNSGGRYCIGTGSNPTVNWSTGTQPAGVYFLEGQNNRANPTTCSTCSVTEEGTAPGLKPYSQHDSNFGVDYQIKPTVAFEARWDRRRLDNAIEDSAIFNPSIGETFVIVNPGKGVNSTFNGFWNFLYGVAPDCTDNTCPANQKVIPAARSYDGIELRITKAESNHWSGMASYTWSNFRGNYAGLTSSDLGDGGGGRNAPNNSRAFDEPYFSWDANGKSSSGPLATDRPNTVKGYVYYDLKWLKYFATDFGVFQTIYEGTPLTSEIDVGYSYAGQPAFPTDIVDRGKWIDVSQNPTTGVITTSAPYVKRTPTYTQSDFNIKQVVKLGGVKQIAFDATFANVMNQHAVVAYWENIDSDYSGNNFLAPSGLFIGNGLNFYSAVMSKYDYTAAMNTGADNGTPYGGPIVVDSMYGKPYFYQQPRNIRFALHFTF